MFLVICIQGVCENACSEEVPEPVAMGGKEFCCSSIVYLQLLYILYLVVAVEHWEMILCLQVLDSVLPLTHWMAHQLLTQTSLWEPSMVCGQDQH